MSEFIIVSYYFINIYIKIYILSLLIDAIYDIIYIMYNYIRHIFLEPLYFFAEFTNFHFHTYLFETRIYQRKNTVRILVLFFNYDKWFFSKNKNIHIKLTLYNFFKLIGFFIFRVKQFSSLFYFKFLIVNLFNNFIFYKFFNKKNIFNVNYKNKKIKYMTWFWKIRS